MARPVQGIADLIVQAKHWRERVITGDSRAFLDDVIARLEFDAIEFDRLMASGAYDVHKPKVVRYETLSAVIVKIVTLLSQVDVMLGLGEHSIKLFTNDERDWLLDVAHGRIEIGDPKAGWAGPMNVRTADGGRTHYSPDLRSPPDPDGG